MEETKARLNLTQAIIEAIWQGLTLDDVKKILKTKVDLENRKGL